MIYVRNKLKKKFQLDYLKNNFIHSYTYIKNLMFISLAINPTTYIVIFLLLGVVLKSKRWERLCLTLSALLFLLFSNGALYQWIAEQWYKEYDRPLPERKQYTYGIVLGGYSYWDWKRSRPEFSEIADRLLEGIRLYKHGRIRKLVLASDGSIIESKDRKGLQGNAADMKQYLADLGMPLEDVILETRANKHVGKRNVHVRADR